MAATTVARKLRLGRGTAVKLGLLGTAAATAATLAITSAPLASAALEVNQQIYTAGSLVNLLPGLGLSTIPISLGALPVVGEATLILNLVPLEYDTQSIYNDINALPFKQRTGLFPPPVFDRTYSVSGQFPAVLSSGIGSGNAVQAHSDFQRSRRCHPGRLHPVPARSGRPAQPDQSGAAAAQPPGRVAAGARRCASGAGGRFPGLLPVPALAGGPGCGVRRTRSRTCGVRSARHHAGRGRRTCPFIGRGHRRRGRTGTGGLTA